MAVKLNTSQICYFGHNYTKVKISPFNLYLNTPEECDKDGTTSKNVKIRQTRYSFCYITKMWQIALLICDCCGERKNNVGYHCPSTFIISITTRFCKFNATFASTILVNPTC